MNDALFDLNGRVIVVTGGLGQLGRQFCRTFLERGARVAILDKSADGGDDRAASESDAENLIVLQVDITDRGAIEGALEKIRPVWGVPHGLVNNAALDTPPDAPAEENGPFETYPEESFDEVMRVNVKGLMQCCQVFGGAMAREGRGSIINISSTYGMVSPNQQLYQYRRDRGETFFKPIAYSVSKSAILNLTRYLATYWGGLGVRVNTVTFGGVFNHQEEAFLTGYCSRTPIGRMASEHEYNGAMVFLLSDASSYMTGSNLVIDGGWTAW